MSGRPRSKLLVSILGRSLMVVLITLLGAIGGMAAGYYHAWSVSNPVPPPPRAMGAAGAGLPKWSITPLTSPSVPPAGPSWGW
jgi:hypothetical protein